MNAIDSTGVVLFDATDSPFEGWSCESGGEPRRITHLGALPTARLWVTNIPYPTFRSLNLIKSQHLRDSQYFRTGLGALAREVGYEDPEQASAHLALVSHEIRRLGHELLDVPWSAPGYRYLRLIGDSISSAAMRSRPAGDCAADVIDALAGAMQVNQAMYGLQKPPTAQPYPFLAPRVSYNKWLLSCDYPAPGAAWERWPDFPRGTFGVQWGKHVDGDGTSRALDKLIGLIRDGRTALFVIDCEHIERDHVPYAQFGSGSNVQRHAAALPEVLAMASYASITIRDAFVVDAASLQMPRQLSLWMAAPAQDAGIAAGLFLEQCAAGLSFVPGKAPFPTPVAVWMRAYDRYFCCRQAERFASAGLTVGSYAYGRIIMLLRASDISAACEIGDAASLYPDAVVLRRGGSP